MHQNRTTILAALLFVLTAVTWTPISANWGVPDQVPGASLLVPFFEVGIDPATHPHNTLLTIYAASTSIVHLEIWNIDGESTRDLYRNYSLGPGETVAVDLRSVIASGGPVDRTLLTDGAFFRGFVTIDGVTATVENTPFSEGYPFTSNNALMGSIYYVRLAQGSANGLPMIPLERTASSGVPTPLQGFYSSDDLLEEIDLFARLCSARLSSGVYDNQDADACFASQARTATIRARIFQSTPLSGSSRVVVFAWDTFRRGQGGPTAICADDPGLGCPTEYDYVRLLEDGSNAESGKVKLDHVVNVITPSGTTGSGQYLIQRISYSGDVHLFAMSFNSASPPGNPNINWDAIFESNIDVYEPLVP